jgi:hypothetical protein
VHDHLDVVHRDAEQEVRLDHLEPLVDEGRGVDRDDRTHVPGRMVHGLLRCHVGEVRPAAAAERSPAGGQHEPSYLVGATTPQALGEGTVLAVDGHDLGGLRPVEHHRARR